MVKDHSSIEEIRRHQLIEAAYETFLEYGLAGTTMARISKRSGLSQSIVNYYFDSKDELVFAFVRKAYFRTIAETAQGLRQAKTPRERVDVVIRAHLGHRIFTVEGAKAWVNFYGFLDRRPDLARLQTVFDRRVLSNLVHALSELVPREAAKAIAMSIVVLIDGFWMRKSVLGIALTSAEAILLTRQAVDLQLASISHRERDRD